MKSMKEMTRFIPTQKRKGFEQAGGEAGPRLALVPLLAWEARRSAAGTLRGRG